MDLNPACSAFLSSVVTSNIPREPFWKSLDQSDLSPLWVYDSHALPARPLLSVPLPLPPGLTVCGVRHFASRVPGVTGVPLDSLHRHLVYYLIFIFPPHEG